MARKQRGLSQRELSLRIGLKSTRYIGMIENGLVTQVEPQRLARIFTVLRLNAQERKTILQLAEAAEGASPRKQAVPKTRQRSHAVRGTAQVGKLVRAARTERGLTQKALAARLGLPSSSAYVGMLESGLTKGVSLARVYEIARVLRLDPARRDELLAAAGHLPLELEQLLLANPGRWPEVARSLGGSYREPRKSSLGKAASGGGASRNLGSPKRGSPKATSRQVGLRKHGSQKAPSRK